MPFPWLCTEESDHLDIKNKIFSRNFKNRVVLLISDVLCILPDARTFSLDL